MSKFNWVKYHDQIKSKYMTYAPNMWWGDDLDVRFFLLKSLSGIKDKKILDVGCNIGLTISLLDESNDTYGIDIDDSCIDKARLLNPKSIILKGSMDNLQEFEDGIFDIIIMGNVLPGFDFGLEGSREDFIQKTFREITRILAKTGKVYFTTPNGESVHYKNRNKVGYEKLQGYFTNAGLSGEILGWNSIPSIWPKVIANSNINNRYKFVPAKILCKHNFIWTKLVGDMYNHVKFSKYYYAELSNVRGDK